MTEELIIEAIEHNYTSRARYLQSDAFRLFGQIANKNISRVEIAAQVHKAIVALEEQRPAQHSNIFDMKCMLKHQFLDALPDSLKPLYDGPIDFADEWFRARRTALSSNPRKISSRVVQQRGARQPVMH